VAAREKRVAGRAAVGNFTRFSSEQYELMQIIDKIIVIIERLGALQV
jgi:hypothetical protein